MQFIGGFQNLLSTSGLTLFCFGKKEKPPTIQSKQPSEMVGSLRIERCNYKIMLTDKAKARERETY